MYDNFFVPSIKGVFGLNLRWTKRIRLDEIQPGEPYLLKSQVLYFQKNPNKIFDSLGSIIVVTIEGYPFTHWAFTGNERLLVLWENGVIDGLLVPVSYMQHLELASKFDRSYVLEWKPIDLEHNQSLFEQEFKSPAEYVKYVQREVYEKVFLRGLKQWADFSNSDRLLSRSLYNEWLDEEYPLPLVLPAHQDNERDVRNIKHGKKTRGKPNLRIVK